MLKELLLSIGLCSAIGVGGVVQSNDHTPSRTIYPYSDFVAFSYDDEKSSDVTRKTYISNTNSGVLVYRDYPNLTTGGLLTFDSANLSFWFDPSSMADDDLMFPFSPFRLGNSDYLSGDLPQINLNMGNNITPNVKTFSCFPLFQIVPYRNYSQYTSNNACCVWFAYHYDTIGADYFENVWFASFIVCNANGTFNYFFNESNPLLSLSITTMSTHFISSIHECETHYSAFYVGDTNSVSDTIGISNNLLNVDYISYDDMLNFNFSINLPNSINDDDYQRGYNDGKQVGYEDGYNQGENAGYQNGVTDGQNLGNTLGGLFTTIADIPIRMIHSMTNFDLFGVSLFVGIMSLATLSIVVFVIKKVV